eukprot:CAMPEP_0172419696 /NCGR_PEP_ID=MMETSP1064-20121228/6089_1 /TAXON_ID=202472 /ORGANISM="Aulacoseira subarctica , Strain CCAP 1002/5" /LENGTH=223 /DNA_ID=CAMNT_0013159279 /DNA_START=37 /DNA_END=708 /DNA_ORIENTATION=-
MTSNHQDQSDEEMPFVVGDNDDNAEEFMSSFLDDDNYWFFENDENEVDGSPTTVTCTSDPTASYSTSAGEAAQNVIKNNVMNQGVTSIFGVHVDNSVPLSAVPSADYNIAVNTPPTYNTPQAASHPQLSQEIEQLKRLVESMRRSEITRSQIIRERQAMAAMQQQPQQFDDQSLQILTDAMRQGRKFDTQSMQYISDWLSGQIAQSMRQLESYIHTMTYGSMM